MAPQHASPVAVIQNTQTAMFARESTPKAIATCRKCQRSYGRPELTRNIVPRPSPDGARLYVYECECGGPIVLSERNGLLAQVRNPSTEQLPTGSIDATAFSAASSQIESAVKSFRSAKAASASSGQSLRSNLPNPDPDRRKMRPSTADVVARDNHAIISKTDAVIARLAASFGCHVGGKRDVEGFIGKLASATARLLDDISVAHSQAGEMDCACSAVLSHEVQIDESVASAMSGDAMRGMLSGLFAAIDSASTELFGCHVSAIKAVTK